RRRRRPAVLAREGAAGAAVGEVAVVERRGRLVTASHQQEREGELPHVDQTSILWRAYTRALRPRRELGELLLVRRVCAIRSADRRRSCDAALRHDRGDQARGRDVE